MISSGTLHVIGTELVVGTFVLSGIAFLMLFLQKGVHSSDIVAHWALFAGLVFTPLAIFSGISASPNGPEECDAFQQILAFLRSNRSLSWFVVEPISEPINPYEPGSCFTWHGDCMSHFDYCLFRGHVLQGESLTPFLPKDVAFVFPAWASVILLIMGLILAGKSAVEHR